MNLMDGHYNKVGDKEGSALNQVRITLKFEAANKRAWTDWILKDYGVCWRDKCFIDATYKALHGITI